jgi:hypothetical protein
MAGKNTSVFGIYRARIDLEHAVDTLRAEGFRSADISVLFPDNQQCGIVLSGRISHL